MKSRKALNRVRTRRTARNRARIFGTATRPRLSVFRSNRSIYVQLIDDEKGKTIAHASSSETAGAQSKQKKSHQSATVGELIAKRALERGVKKAIADRGKYRYHGRVKALVEAARKSGLQI